MSDNRWILASTPALDRDGDRVLPLGLTNPLDQVPLIFGHDYHQPGFVIGRTQKTEVDASGVRVLPSWRQSTGAGDPMGIIQQLIDQELVAYSIGFIPKVAQANEYGGRDHTAWELLEVSAVPVPSNPEARLLALRAEGLAVAKGWTQRPRPIDRPEIRYRLARVIDSLIEYIETNY